MRLAFASCVKLQDQNPQAVWAAISAARPDVLLLLGDLVYLDRNDHDDPAALAAELRALHAAQLAEPNFAALMADLHSRGALLRAVYDDHDFLGDNRCGGDHPPAWRDAARAEFVRAYGARQAFGQENHGELYGLTRLGAVDLVLLDTRFHRRSDPASMNEPDAVLGAAQWAWLERTLQGSVATYLVLASSITLHAFGAESWERYPAAFARLGRLLKGRRGGLFVSGDVHHNAVYDDSGVIEIVSSGAARRGMVFDALRQNHGLLEFGPDRVRVQLSGLKVGNRFDFEIPLSDWQLP